MAKRHRIYTDFTLIDDTALVANQILDGALMVRMWAVRRLLM